MQEYSVYILRAEDNQLYIGQTSNVQNRLKLHESGHGAKFIKSKSFTLVYEERFDSRGAAMKREKQLKGWTRAKKEALIAGNYKLLKQL